MFLPPRFVVIDDNPKHLGAILSVFQELGTSCLGVVFDPERGLENQRFDGVRGLFVDLHLTESTVTTDETRHFATIAGILETSISPAGGPFVLVVWTEHEQYVQGLKEYLDESLDDDAKPHTRPIAVMGLPKDRFIEIATGKILGHKAEELRDAVEGTLSEKPQLAALLAWEADVVAAAGATLSTLIDLVPVKQRGSTTFASGLDEVLSRLASAAVGEPHVGDDRRAAITTALAPILADRIVNQTVSPANAEIWERAVTRKGKGAVSPKMAGMVNRMLHVAIPASEAIQPTDWGAVVEFPYELDDNTLQRLFGVTSDQLLHKEFKIEQKDRDRCRPRLVRVGAACDHAQNRLGPLWYLFGLEIACDIKRNPPSASEWSSPYLLLEPNADPFFLAVNSRYSVNVPRAEAGKWQRAYRLREQLIMHLISHAGSYLTRPGIVQL
ncbi:MAG: hypothetical protein OXI15_06230 [Chromatiales bacterium]|nr:hypothetical protein [Chromatiales bacterium]